MAKEDLEVLNEKIEEGEKNEKKKKRAEKRAMRKQNKKAMRADFKKFITRGNIFEMSIGVIVGSAFTAIITALSNNILKPFINYLLAFFLKEDSLSEIYTFLKRVNAEDGTPDLAQSIYIDWGAFINAIINFVLIALTLFILLRVLTQLFKALDATLNEERIEKEKEEKAKKDAEDKAKAEKEKAEQEALRLREAQFYENVQKQTEMLSEIKAYLAEEKK